MGAPIIPLDFLPGIQRDGTELDANRALDALWCRWRLARPRKIGGYQDMEAIAGAGIPRRIHCYYSGANVYVHVGTAFGLWQIVLDQNGNFVSVANRTPVAFPGTANLSWTLDAIFDTTSSALQLIAHAATNALLTASATQSTPYLGILTDSAPLVFFSNPGAPGPGIWTKPSIAGGIVCVQPFVFDFDINGLVQWSAPNLPLYLGVTQGSSGAGQARISAQKVVAGMPLRGGGAQSPAALFWTLSEVISAVYVGTPAWFSFNTISPSSSILGPSVVIEYDCLYFWAGVGRFLVFNGTVQELPNNQNQDWFFDNLTTGYEAKTFAFKVPRYGEIWWCAPMFGATEPSHAVIYNLRENCWYDTALPANFSAAYFAQGFRYPLIMRGQAGGAVLSLFDKGTDAVDVNGVPTALRSYFETPWIGGPRDKQPNDRGLSYQQFEPDFIQSGDMTAQVIGTANTRSPLAPGPVTTIPAAPTVDQQLIGYKESHRLGRLHIESNLIGGSFIGGRNLLHAEPSEQRQTSG